MSEKKIELTKSEQIGDTREHIADLVNASVSVLKEENKNALLKLLETHHESDIAEMIALLNGGQREQFFALIGEDLADRESADVGVHAPRNRRANCIATACYLQGDPGATTRRDIVLTIMNHTWSGHVSEVKKLRKPVGVSKR